jgi:hypothetical protein
LLPAFLLPAVEAISEVVSQCVLSCGVSNDLLQGTFLSFNTDSAVVVAVHDYVMKRIISICYMFLLILKPYVMILHIRKVSSLSLQIRVLFLKPLSWQ